MHHGIITGSYRVVDGTNIDNWTMEDLMGVVAEFTGNNPVQQQRVETQEDVIAEEEKEENKNDDD